MAATSAKHNQAGVGPADGNGERLARGLGWFSLGLGVASLAAPRTVAQMVGLDDTRTQGLLRAVGLREIATGIGILTGPSATPWLRARVAGDAMDLALLTSAMASPRADQQRLKTAVAATLGIVAIDALGLSQLVREPDGMHVMAQDTGDVEARAAITINAPTHEVYQFWDGFQNLPRFMSDFASVSITGPNRSHWAVRGPVGISVQWDAEITESRPDELIAWRTLPGSDVEATGEIRFRPAPGGRGAEVRQDTWFSLPGGELGRKIGQVLAGGLGVQMENDLRRAKQLIEIGEIVQSDDSVVRGPNPAQPTATNAA